MTKTFETLLQEYRSGVWKHRAEDAEEPVTPSTIGWSQADSKSPSEVRFITYEVSRQNSLTGQWEVVTRHSAKSLAELEGRCPRLFAFEGEFRIAPMNVSPKNA